MRTSIERKTMDLEARDTNYWLQAYLINYLFVSQNEDPVKAIIPMFPSFPHPRKPGVMIPIEWVEPDSPVAAEIAEDGGGIPAAEMPVPEEVVVKPDSEPIWMKSAGDSVHHVEAGRYKAKDDRIQQAKNIITKTTSLDRQPKMPPGGDIGAGHPDGLSSRDARLEHQIARDLAPESDVDESKEIPVEIKKPA